MDIGLEYFTNTIARDLLNISIDKLLGTGIGRAVYVFKPNPHLVIKFETASHSFQNIIEWETWGRAQDRPAQKWLAPCHSISTCGSVLLMERTEPIPERFKLPPRIPKFLTDFKRENYGLIKGKLVCHDYGTNGAVDLGLGKGTKALRGRGLTCKSGWI